MLGRSVRNGLSESGDVMNKKIKKKWSKISNIIQLKLNMTNTKEKELKILARLYFKWVYMRGET